MTHEIVPGAGLLDLTRESDDTSLGSHPIDIRTVKLKDYPIGGVNIGMTHEVYEGVDQIVIESYGPVERRSDFSVVKKLLLDCLKQEGTIPETFIERDKEFNPLNPIILSGQDLPVQRVWDKADQALTALREMVPDRARLMKYRHGLPAKTDSQKAR